LAAGLISALALFGAVIGFSAIGVPVCFWTLAGWLSLVAAGGGWFWWRRRAEIPPRSEAGREWWLWWPALPLVLVAVWRATQQPLPGADVDFRWNYLAELLVQRGNLNFYPPRAATDFVQYFWADGIAPMVSSIYAWTYLAAGTLDRHWTAVPVLLQSAGLLLLLHGLGSCWGGPRAGWLAAAVGGGCFLLQFAFNLGQETGLTALGGAGMVFYLTRWQRERRDSLLLPAAAAAALAACAREYGWAMAWSGSLWVLAVAGGKRAGGFTLLALCLPAAWHLRNFWLTGNPVYAMDLAGIFPVNPVFSAWMSGYAEIYSTPFWHAAGWAEIGRLLGIGALPALAGLAAGGVVFRRQPGALGTAWVAGIVVICWVMSVPFTAGGLFYSMRVLSPLLVLGCAWGGALLARWVPGRRHLAGVLVGLGLYGLDAALRAWTVPANPYRLAPREWAAAGYGMQREFDENSLPFLRTAAARCTGKVLSETAGAQRVFRAAGKELIPVWSPEVAFLFGPAGAKDAARRLQDLGYTHVLLTRVQSSVDFLARTGALERLNGQLETVMVNDTFVLFALRQKPPVRRPE
jgi:hypothetical protein